MWYENTRLLSYAEYGDKNGFPILIQHGLIASIRDADIFDHLLRLKTCLICIARPGYGESSPYKMSNIGEWGEIVSALVAELDLSQFDVLGMSSGAPYSYAIGYKFPDRARNIFIFSGTPALYDKKVQPHWPFPLTPNADITEMQKLAYELFFSNASDEDRKKNDIHDSMMNNCFGLAQDFRLRCMDWGFRLSEVTQSVYMQHSKNDPNVPFITAEITAGLLPNCQFIAKESDIHFSQETLDEFIDKVMARHYEKQ